MKYCRNCGLQVDDNGYCANCGFVSNKNLNETIKIEAFNEPDDYVKERNIVFSIVFSIITLGIYNIYWMIKLNDESLLVSKEKGRPGAVVFLLVLITLGIYEYFWWYKMGTRCDKIDGKEKGFSNILYVVLSIFGLSIVNYALSQNTLNNYKKIG